MTKVFQICSEVNVGSVGRIAEQIGLRVISKNWESFIAYGRDMQPSKSTIIKIGNKFDILKHVLITRFTDKHGYGSSQATLKLIDEIERVNPHIIHLHHLHGYFINIEILFGYLSKLKIPIVWTFHDCWAFTGHCCYYEMVGCHKWQTECSNCPQIKEYPQSWLKDNSYQNFIDKKRIFNSLHNLTIVPVSNWLGGEVSKSFLKNNKIEVIRNGIELDVFRFLDTGRKKRTVNSNEKIVLGVASPWNERKGLKYFIELSKILPDSFKIVLVGLNKSQIKKLPSNIMAFERTSSTASLAEFYSMADVFVNPTLDEALGLTNLEAMACGTPVITFNSGGSVEAITEKTGLIVKQADVDGLYKAIETVIKNGKENYSAACRNYVEENFSGTLNFNTYISLYERLLS